MRRTVSSPHPDWVPRRWTLYEKRSRSSRWLIERPGRLLAWWVFLALFSLAGIALALTVMPLYYLPVFIVPTWLQLVVDLRCIPRAFRAWRGNEGDGAGPTSVESSPRNAAHRGGSR